MTATASPPAVHPAARSIPVWLGIVAASLPMFMATLDNLVMTSALPVLTVPAVTGSPGALATGRLSPAGGG